MEMLWSLRLVHKTHLSYCLPGFFCDIIPGMKRTYELMVIAKSDFPVEDTKKVDELITRLVKGATIKDITVLGKKQLAYPIKKQSEGIYILVSLEGSSLNTGDLETESKLGTDIIRFMLIQKEG